MAPELIDLFYLIAAVLFIFGLKGLSHPRTAVRGNLLGSAGMLLAVVVTLLDRRIVSFEVIVAGVVVGALVGVILAYKVSMTAMPQVVAVFNGFGGGASALAVGAALEEALKGGFVEEISVQFTIAAAASALIGGVSFTGSAIAFGKLQGLVNEKPVLFTGRHVLNAGLLVVCLGLSVWLAFFLQNLVKEGQLHLNLEDEIIGDTLLAHQGELVNPQVQELLAQPASTPANDERRNS